VSVFSLSQSSLPFFHLLQSPQITFQASLLEIKYLDHFGPGSLKCLAPYKAIAIGSSFRSRSQRPISHVLQGYSALQCLIFSTGASSLWRFLLGPFSYPSSSVLKIQTAGCATLGGVSCVCQEHIPVVMWNTRFVIRNLKTVTRRWTRSC
jgi:hypothetical protein